MESWDAIVGRPQGVRPSSRPDGSAAISFLEKLYWIWGNNWSLPEELAMSPGPGPAPAVAVTRMRSAGRRLTLGDVAGDRVDLVAERMKAMKAEQLEEIKSELRLILEGLEGGHYAVEFLYLKKLVQGRDDLTPAILLSAAHRVQLLLLVAIKTRSKTFIDPLVLISEGDLADILLERRCENIDCLSALPAGGCQCDICTARKGFCRNCTCVICNNKFNFEIYSCLWFECGVCCHCTHTDCAMDDGAERCTIKKGKDHTKTLICCQSCQGMSELLTWVRELFLCFAPAWDKDSLSQQLKHVCRMFDRSEDPEERKFVTKCAELLGLLSSGKDKAMCREMLLQELQAMYDKEQMQEALESILTDTSAEPIKLSYAFLENITNGFSQEIGRGGFAVVYMGVLKSMKVAVKKLFQTVEFSDKQFEDELKCLRRVKHKNIVRFLGYCCDIEEEQIEHKGQIVKAERWRRALCFEYVPNKNLHDYLKDESHRYEWDTRCQLIEGICHGLRYLHNNERITHLDLKPENILLDADMVPKITDFGISRRCSGEQSRIITKSNARGTPGYIAPEYWSKGEISYKADIYSLGIIIRKLFCGSTDSSDLENWYQSLMVSPQVKKCIKISRLCVDDNPRKRPTIDCIIDMLSEKETMTEMQQLQGYFGPDNRCQRSFVKSSYSSGECIGWHPSLDIESTKVKRCIKIAQLCVEDDPCKRPTIDCRIDMLIEKETAVDKVSQIFGHSRNNSGSSKEQGCLGSEI